MHSLTHPLLFQLQLQLLLLLLPRPFSCYFAAPAPKKN